MMHHFQDCRRPTAAELARHCRLNEDALRLLDTDQSPRRFFERLVDKGLLSAAIRFLPHALPKQAAVWWGGLCLWHMVGPAPDVKTAAALRAALDWVADPSEANRQAAETPGRAAGLNTAAGCLAMAAFWSGGSMVRPELPPVPPPRRLTAKMVGASVLLAAVLKEPFHFRHHYRQFLALGVEVARGDCLWSARPVPASVSSDAVALADQTQTAAC